MSKYTTELRWIIEQTESALPPDNKPDGATYHDETYTKIGLGNWPEWKSGERYRLNDLIISHFYLNEIGAETADQFALYMRTKMNIIMPYYNKLYKALDEMTNPLSDYERKKDGWTLDKTTNEYDDTHRESWDENRENTSRNRNVYQDTPMSLLDSNQIENLQYATNVDYDNGSNTGINTGSRDNAHQGQDTRTYDDKYGERIVGRNKSEAALMKEYLDMLQNLDQRVIDELEPLFMQLW